MTRRLLAVLIVAMVAIPIAPPAPERARAFDLSVHEQILRAALGDGNTMSEEALGSIIGFFVGVLGSGNRGQDTASGQFHAEYHFDSARNPVEICARWRAGLNAFLEEAVAMSEPVGVEKRQLKARNVALDSFGKATHALADFYAHTNWLEIAVDSGQLADVAPLTGTTCEPQRFPPDLESGFADAAAFAANGAQGENAWCPGRTPPPGFRWCHDEINKDEDSSPQGRTVHPTGVTYHDLAALLATQATKQLWDGLHARIVARYETDRTIDAECVFMKLAWGGERTCHRLWRARGAQAQRGADESMFMDSDTVNRFEWERSATGLDFRLRWQPVPYPGPNAAAATAVVETTPAGGQIRESNVRTYAGSFGRTTITCELRGANIAPSGGNGALPVQPLSATMSLRGLYGFEGNLAETCTYGGVSSGFGGPPGPAPSRSGGRPSMRGSYAFEAEPKCQDVPNRLELRSGSQTLSCRYDESSAIAAARSLGVWREAVVELTLEAISEDW